jgi:hypothetical protein
MMSVRKAGRFGGLYSVHASPQALQPSRQPWFAAWCPPARQYPSASPLSRASKPRCAQERVRREAEREARPKRPADGLEFSLPASQPGARSLRLKGRSSPPRSSRCLALPERAVVREGEGVAACCRGCFAAHNLPPVICVVFAKPNAASFNGVVSQSTTGALCVCSRRCVIHQNDRPSGVLRACQRARPTRYKGPAACQARCLQSHAPGRACVFGRACPQYHLPTYVPCCRKMRRAKGGILSIIRNGITPPRRGPLFCTHFVALLKFSKCKIIWPVMALACGSLHTVVSCNVRAKRLTHFILTFLS